MLLIQRVTNSALQNLTLALDDGTSFSLQLYYRPLQQGWFINNLTYGENFILNGMRIVNSPNMLNQFRNKLPFGLACFTVGNREPSLIEDFSSEQSNLYVLSFAEVEEFSEYLTLG